MSLWGPLENRYQTTKRPRKLLTLDGGGIRGVLTLQVLIRMEELLREHLLRFREASRRSGLGTGERNVEEVG